MLIVNRRPGPGLVHHSDQGCKYHAKAYRNALRRLGIRQSTSRTGSCLDGAAAESFFATIKAVVGAGFWPDRVSARRDIETWITSYNERRLHSALGYRPPNRSASCLARAYVNRSISKECALNRVHSSPSVAGAGEHGRAV